MNIETKQRLRLIAAEELAKRNIKDLQASKMYRRYTSTNKSLLEQIEGLDELFTLDGVSYIEYIDYLIRFLVDKNIEKATKDKAISIVTQLRAKMETETNDINAAREAGVSPEEIIQKRMFAYSTTDKPDLSKPLPAQAKERKVKDVWFDRAKAQLLKYSNEELDSFISNIFIDGGYEDQRAKQDREQRLSYLKRTEAKERGHVYFYESAGNFKIGKSCCEQIHTRLRRQRPDKVIAISEASNNYHKLEKDLHREYASKRMGRYEIFCGLTKTEIKKITEKLKSNWKLVEGINRDLNFRKSLALSTV